MSIISFSVTSVVTDDASNFLLGASDVDLIQIGGSWRLAVSAEADSALTIFDFSGGMIGAELDKQTFNSASGIRTVWDINAFTAHGQTVLAPATRYEDDAMLYTVAADGNLTRRDPVLSGDLGLSTTLTTSGGTFFFSQAPGTDDLFVYRVETNFALTQVQSISDTSSTFLGDISALTTARAHGNDYLFVTSAFDSGLSVYQIASNGTLTLRDVVEPSDGSGFNLPSALVAVEVSGTNFIIMGSSGTSSLTVYEIGSDGSLTEVEHLLDTLDTRFQSVTQLVSFEFGGAVYIVAAGSDDGLSILEVGTNGQLTERGTIADTFDITLDNISGIDVEVIGDQVFLVVSSSTDHGVAVLEVTFETPPDPIQGSNGDDYLRGTSGADVIIGMDGDDLIEARGGADIIYDGNGQDTIDAGGGPDVLVFEPDGEVDIVLGFQPEWDTLDLSGYTGVSSFADIDVRDYCVGLAIFVNDDVIFLEGDHGNPFVVEDINTSNVIF